VKRAGDLSADYGQDRRLTDDQIASYGPAIKHALFANEEERAQIDKHRFPITHDDIYWSLFYCHCYN
jgi:hypothetical protein